MQAVRRFDAALSTSLVFAHIAIGGGFSTIFAIHNTGSGSLEGNLILTGQDGKPLAALLSESFIAEASPSVSAALASSIPIAIPQGGVKFLTATSPSPGDPLKAGWARLESTGGTPGGVATFQYIADGKLATIAGVLAAESMENATIALNDDVSANRYTGYAVANPGSESVTIKAVTVKEDGTAGLSLQSITLAPGEQKAQFVFQDPAAGSNFIFKGSLVLIGQNGKKFSAVALVQDRNLYTAIPVIAGKAPGIGESAVIITLEGQPGDFKSRDLGSISCGLPRTFDHLVTWLCQGTKSFPRGLARRQATP